MNNAPFWLLAFGFAAFISVVDLLEQIIRLEFFPDHIDEVVLPPKVPAIIETLSDYNPFWHRLQRSIMLYSIQVRVVIRRPPRTCEEPFRDTDVSVSSSTNPIRMGPHGSGGGAASFEIESAGSHTHTHTHKRMCLCN